jgi:uncharacterized integral membrane protein
MRRDHDDRPPERPPAGGSEDAADVAARLRGGEDQLKHLERERRARVAKVVALLAILVVLMLFILWNSQAVKVSFVFASGHPPLIWVMLACAVLGGVAGYLIGKPGRQIRLRRRTEPTKPS